MDSSKIASLSTSRPTIASRRPMLHSQRSLSALSINTSATHNDLMRRNSSTSTANRLRRIQTSSPPPPMPASAGMSPEELSSKIADSFQQFSSMLSQLSTHKSPSSPLQKKSLNMASPVTPSHVTTTATVMPSPRSSSPPQPPLLTSPVTTAPQGQPKSSKREKRKKSLTSSTSPTCELNETELEILKSHAIYSEKALDSVGNTKLRQLLLIKWFNRAASIGDVSTMKRLLAAHKGELDINASDDSSTGITPLMYAAYFGHTECLELLLLSQEQQVNLQDKKGWTALMWAAHGQQVASVQTLLAHHADTETKSRGGKTVFEYAISDEVKLALGVDERKNKKEETVVAYSPPTTPTPTSVSVPMERSTTSADSYSIDGYSHFISQQHTDTASKRKSVMVEMPMLSPPDFSQLLVNNNNNSSRTIATPVKESFSTLENIEEWEQCIKSCHTFSWNQCLPDQMFVFSQENMHLILDHALSVGDTRPLMNKHPLSNELWQPANIVFLSARFAHYWSSRDVLNALLNTAIFKLSRIIKASSRDTQILAFWIANMCQLTSYLKRDTGLSIVTLEIQEAISGLISEAYTYFVTESQKRLEKLLESSMMEYESIQELEQVDFVDDWQRFFRRSSMNTIRRSIEIPVTNTERKHSLDIPPMSQYQETPNSITQLLSHLKETLQAYHVPPPIVIQAMAQFFHYLSCEMFNRVLTYKKYLCRSKALQIRMNLSVLEDWVRETKLPTSLNQSFQPLVQLLQLLQCLSQMEDVLLFSSTIQTFDKLNALQVKRCVQNYRYEVSEPRLSEEVEGIANQWVLDHQQHWRNHELNKKASIENIEDGKRPSSISSLNCLLSTTSNSCQGGLVATATATATTTTTTTIEQQPGEEKRNSRYMLPFSVLETTALLEGWTHEQRKSVDKNDIMLYSDNIYKEIKLNKRKQGESNLLDKAYPSISEEWLYHLDKRMHH